MRARNILIAITAMAMSACAKTVEQPKFEVMPFTIHAYQEGFFDTKTTVKEGGTQVYWETNDEINVFFRGNGGRFISNNSQIDMVTEFSGTLNILVGLNESASGSNDLWGLYPYRSDATSDELSVTTTLPAEQAGRAGSFAKNTHITLAHSNSLDLAFYNVTGGLRFSLTQEGIKSVTFEGNNGETLAGIIKIAFESGVPVVKDVSECETVLTLTAPGGSTFQTGKWYYIEAIPVTLSNGFKMVLSKGTETAIVSSSGSVTISRGKYGSLANADEGLIFKETGEGGEHNPSSFIQFDDLVAKYACVEKFDTNGDGEVSYEEAAAATTLSGLFTNWRAVKSFDEIRFFTGAISLGGAFNGCDQIKKIVIPDNIKSLGWSEFFCCEALESVTLSNSITEITGNCFANCHSLKSIDLPVSVEYLDGCAFYQCTSLNNVVLRSGIKMSDFVFAGCTSLTNITLPADLESIPIAAFQGCTALEGIVIPNSVKQIQREAFSNCTSLYNISFPASLELIGDKAFNNCDFINPTTLESMVSLPSSITYIGSGNFNKVHNVLLTPNRFVETNGGAFTPGVNIFVPRSLLNGYALRSDMAECVLYLAPLEEYVYSTSNMPVDLGLSVSWGKTNVANTTSWGNLHLCTAYNQEDKWQTYKFYENDSYLLTKYCTNGEYGTVDDLVTLEPEDDEATVKLGAPWRMPTKSEAEELLENCTFYETKCFGVNGYMAKSNIDGYKYRYIFLPYHDDYWILSPSPYGFSYWTSSLCKDDPRKAYCFNSKEITVRDRMCGIAIRAVYPKD